MRPVQHSRLRCVFATAKCCLAHWVQRWHVLQQSGLKVKFPVQHRGFRHVCAAAAAAACCPAGRAWDQHVQQQRLQAGPQDLLLVRPAHWGSADVQQRSVSDLKAPGVSTAKGTASSAVLEQVGNLRSLTGGGPPSARESSSLSTFSTAQDFFCKLCTSGTAPAVRCPAASAPGQLLWGSRR